uniref:hypothetical protein n=1 Tax=Flavobacterium sp. TaxID=239 RepID=UPI00404A0C8A
MGLEKIHLDNIGTILERILKSYTIFFDFSLINKGTQKINSPTKITEYDFTFISENYDRWLFIRIQDFFAHQKLIIFLNQLNVKKNINLDIESFFISELKNNTVKQKLIFKSKSEVELEKHLESIFKYLNDNSNEQLKEIIKGKTWINMPFDWGDYK